LRLRGFGSRLLEDGNVGVGIFPQREEILVGNARLGAIALQGVGAGEAEMPEGGEGRGCRSGA
jgi:hypothetical protein